MLKVIRPWYDESVCNADLRVTADKSSCPKWRGINPFFIMYSECRCLFWPDGGARGKGRGVIETLSCRLNENNSRCTVVTQVSTGLHPISLMTVRVTSIITGLGSARRIRTPDVAVTAWLSVCVATGAQLQEVTCFTTAVVSSAPPPPINGSSSASHALFGSMLSVSVWVPRRVCVVCVPLHLVQHPTVVWPRNRCHTIKLKLNARTAEEKHQPWHRAA